MNFTKLTFSISVLIIVLVISISAAEEDVNIEATMDFSEYPSPANQTKRIFKSDGAEGQSLLRKKRTSRRVTCKKYPRICHARGSPGPQCCKKKCVNILRDRLNCGKCGKKCKYNEICCRGKCVNPSFNRKHCGGCNTRCSNGQFCVFGLCNYA